MNPIAGWLPDADPTTPGVFTDCQHVVSSAAGYVGAPSPIAAAVATVGADVRGATVATDLSGNRRIYAGTQTKLFLLTSGTWSDVSHVAGPYVGSSESRWSFAQFGNTTMASNLTDAMQQFKQGASRFADVPTAPKAKIIVSASNNFVLAFYTNEATYGVSPDRWWCCAQNNQEDWVPNVSTGANTARLIAEEGPITAAGTLGDYVVAYKNQAIFVGSFVGAPVGFQWMLIPGGTAGCIGQDAWCDIGGAHFIVGPDMLWIFDGTRPMPVGLGETRDWFYANSSPAWRYRTQAIYDKLHKLVRVAYPSLTSDGELDATITYNVSTKKWSRDDNNIAAFLNFVQPGTTINGLDSYAATINTLPDVPVDSPFWSAGGEAASYFDSTGKLWNLSGVAQDSYIVTGDMGDDDGVSMIDRFRVRYSLAPTTAQCTGQYKMNEGDAFTLGPVNAINDGKFDIRQSARFHRFRVDMTGPHIETAYDAKPRAAGRR
jgi:hypothetical protein